MEKAPSRLLTILENPLYQTGIIACFIILLSLVEKVLPQADSVLEQNAGPWVVTTAMILCFVILNTIVLFRIKSPVTYWVRSVIFYVVLLVLAYGWCFLLSGLHIDDAGSFRWLWMVLTLVYMIFFAIAYTIRSIIAIADKEDGQ